MCGGSSRAVHYDAMDRRRAERVRFFGMQVFCALVTKHMHQYLCFVGLRGCDPAKSPVRSAFLVHSSYQYRYAILSYKTSTIDIAIDGFYPNQFYLQERKNKKKRTARAHGVKYMYLCRNFYF